MNPDLTFADENLGKWTEENQFEVTRERIAEYAAATNDPIAAHLAGDVGSPVFAIVPVFERMIEPAMNVVPFQLLMRGLHGEQDFHYHRPIRPGETLRSQARMIGYQGLEKGTRAVIQIECRGEDGELVNEQYVTMFFRGQDATNGKAAGDPAPTHVMPEGLRESAPTAKVQQHIDADQTFRYSPASGDPVPIHLDEEAAKNAGLPGIIAHGLCTMAFASWGVLEQVGDSDVSRLKRLAVRFAKTVFPEDDLETRVWKVSSGNGLTTYAFETARGEDLVLTDGLAVIAD
ncbi:MaoC/PaaZ C-terminal domain-containing protein [Aldersonia kunmingensis]|uniref:MaoC/PaaZ C-terminal domain-containing protein n=1 Tax=Aldersonia kunmingensis TaxID=408066 RepID=UPI00083591EB|nr:MaoC/PaaZ C-terminal domain-containing protein [Aldersonia kunmingensis]